MNDAAGEALAPATARSSYPIWASDKIRYGDTDRQGHVNNAVFATFFETGRVVFLYDDDLALAAPGCEFVLARITIDYLAELFYPGTIEIGSRVLRIGRSSFDVGQAIFEGERCVATATSVAVQMDVSTRRSHVLTPAMVEWLSQRLVR